MVNEWSPASVPASHDNKPGWHKLHNKHATVAYNNTSQKDIMLIGDSIVAGLSRCNDVWANYFTDAINLGIGGDMIQNVLWRLRNTRINHSIKFVVAHCGTNNIDFNRPDDIVNGLTKISEIIHMYNPEVVVLLSGILPRGDYNKAPIRRENIRKTNNQLKMKCDYLKNVIYIEHDTDWTHGDGSLNKKYYYCDNLHLNKLGNGKLSNEIRSHIQRIRNDDGVVGNSTLYHQKSLHIFSHSGTLTPPIGKINHVKIPKWEECEYKHIPTTSSPSLTSSPSPPHLSRPYPTPSSSPQPSQPSVSPSTPSSCRVQITF